LKSKIKQQDAVFPSLTHTQNHPPHVLMIGSRNTYAVVSGIPSDGSDSPGTAPAISPPQDHHTVHSI